MVTVLSLWTDCKYRFEGDSESFQCRCRRRVRVGYVPLNLFSELRSNTKTNECNTEYTYIGTYEAGQGLEYLAFLNAAEFDEIPFATCKSKDILTSTLGITYFTVAACHLYLFTFPQTYWTCHLILVLLEINFQL